MRELFHIYKMVKRDFALPIDIQHCCENHLATISKSQSYHEQLVVAGKIFQALTPFINSPDWAWEYGMQLKGNDFGILGLCVICAENLQESLDLLVQFSKVMTPLTLQQKADGDYLYLKILFPDFLLRDLDFHLNIILSGFSQFLYQIYAISPSEIRFNFPKVFEGVTLSHHATHLNIQYGLDHFYLILPITLTAKPNIKSDAKTKEQLLHLWQESRPHSAHDLTATAQVMQYLDNKDDRVYGIEHVASKLHTSARNLRLRLEKEHTTFKELVSQYRMNKASYLLKHTNHKIDAIAEKAGYSSVSNFRRAFKRAFNLTPNQYRDQKNAPENDL